MTNKEFQVMLEEMYNKYSVIRKRKQKTVNELVYVLRMSGEDWQLNLEGIQGNAFACIPSVQDTFIPVLDLVKSVVSVEFDEETYNEYGVKLLMVKTAN